MPPSKAGFLARVVAGLAFCALSSLTLPDAARAQFWSQVSTAGFNSAQNRYLTRGTTATFSGTTYIVFGTSNPYAGAQVWRSSTTTDWNQANSSGFDVNGSSNEAVSWMASFYNGLLAGVSSRQVPTGAGARIYRSSTSADTWTLVFSTATAANSNLSGAESFALWGSKIYVGFKNATSGAEIWRSTSASAPTDWVQVSTNGFGIGTANETVTSIRAFGSGLYAATAGNTTQRGQIWRSVDGLTWSQILVASNTFQLNTQGITALESFNGYLYAGTRHASGAQLWRSADPTAGAGSWTQVTSPDGLANTRFSVDRSSEIRSLLDAGGVLWIGTWEPGRYAATTGGRVYRSTEGTTFPPSASNGIGFGSQDREWIGGFVSTGGYVYAGTRDEALGGSVWRTTGTLPGQPTLSGAAMGVSSIAWTWSTVNVANGYRVYDTAWVNLAGDLQPDTTYSYEAGLTINTAYTRYLAAFNDLGVSTSAALTRFAASTSPYGTAFQMVGGSSVTLTWEKNGNLTGTTYYVSYWVTDGSPLTTNVTTETATITQLNGMTTYYFKVRSANGDGAYSGYDVTKTTCTNPVTYADATADPSAGVEITINTPAGLLSVAIPPGAFENATAVSVSVPASYQAVAASDFSLTATGVGVEITVGGGLQPLKPVLLSIPFRDADVAGMNAARLIIARYDRDHRSWVPLKSSADNNRVSALTTHLSQFQVMQSVPAATLDSVKVFPNPLRPTAGHASMTFVNLPADSDIRIHTFKGSLVRKLRADNAGMASWDGINWFGVPAASGVYLAYIRGNGATRLVKVAIQR
ncbi:MAG: fibronectin type III domain-containing protein [Elusimicrobia bacterium]|nr:fibronectin type III domain-containing protein [Elusimicrobiota bacterium]